MFNVVSRPHSNVSSALPLVITPWSLTPTYPQYWGGGDDFGDPMLVKNSILSITIPDVSHNLYNLKTGHGGDP